MANIDGGHYFLTTLIPVRLDPILRPDGGCTSPSHLIREVLSTLPTAQQSPVGVAAGFNSPFSRCTRTHFVRLFVIDQPMYNGRLGDDALREGFRSVNLLAHQPVDNLSRPYLVFNADFDARADETDGGLASWAAGLWARCEPELRAVFSSCLKFDEVRDASTFAAWIERCRIDTTMSFNDYYVPAPDLHGYTTTGLAAVWVVVTGVLSGLAWAARVALAGSAWWMAAAVPLAALLGLLVVLRLLWIKGSRPFPVGADTDLPSVLKALHVQQRFVLMAAQCQGTDAQTLHDAFARFIEQTKPGSLAEPTQPPGVIRSDGTPLVVHHRVTREQVAS